MAEKQVKDYEKFVVRFPDGMRDAIAERAKANGRSMNSEIVQILQDSIYPRSYDDVMMSDDWKELRYDNPDISEHDEALEKNLKIDGLVQKYAEKIKEYSSNITSLLALRR